MDDNIAIARQLRTRLRKMDHDVIRAMGQECADNPRCAILIRRNFLRGLCGYWSQGLDQIMSAEIANILRDGEAPLAPGRKPMRKPTTR